MNAWKKVAKSKCIAMPPHLCQLTLKKIHSAVQGHSVDPAFVHKLFYRSEGAGDPLIGRTAHCDNRQQVPKMQRRIKGHLPSRSSVMRADSDACPRFFRLATEVAVRDQPLFDRP